MIESTWDTVLRGIDVDRDWHYLCFASLPITGLEPVVLTVEDDWEKDDDDVPAPAAAAGMSRSLDRGQLEGIVDNLKNQASMLTTDQTFAAIRHYYKHDAFIVL